MVLQKQIKIISEVRFNILSRQFQLHLSKIHRIALKMRSQSLQLSSITEEILDVLKNHPTPESLRNKHFLKQLDVLVLNKRPKEHSFVCDSTTSLQIQFKTQTSKPIQEYELNPWNKVMTHYYQVSHEHQKHLFTLNCTDQTLFQLYDIKTQHQDSKQKESQSGGMFAEDTSSYLSSIDKEYEPHAYEPLYYFPRSSFDYFVKNRQNLSLKQPLQKIRILDWVLKVVNISKSNWYAFVIEVYNYKYMNEKVWVDDFAKNQEQKGKQSSIRLKNIGSIIYDQRFKPILENMRLVHIKQDADQQMDTDQEQEISMCYHLRNIQVTHKLPKLSQFVTLDTKGQILKFDKNHPTHFIPIGELQGMCSFPQPVNLNKSQKKEQLRELNAFSMKGLYEILNKQALQSVNSRQIKNRKKGERKRIGEKDWSRMIEERLQNSYYRVHQSKQANEEFSFLSDGQDESNLSEGSQKRQKGQIQKQDGQIGYDESYLMKYSEILHDINQNQQSSSQSSEEENEYFRKYREEMKQMFGK